MSADTNTRTKKSFKEIHGKTRVGMFLKTKAPKLLDSILDVAGDLIPGAEGVTEVISTLIGKDPDLTLEDKKMLLEMFKLDVEDLKSAREMYSAGAKEMTDSLAKKVIYINLPVILLLVILNVVAVYYLTHGEVIAIVSNFIGITIGNLFNERQAVINFFFGSSQGSRDKNKILDKR